MVLRLVRRVAIVSTLVAFAVSFAFVARADFSSDVNAASAADRSNGASAADQSTAAGLCENCATSISGMGSVGGAPLNPKLFSMIRGTNIVLQKDSAIRTCEQIVNSKQCQDEYARIKMAGHDLDDFELKCNQTEFSKLWDENIGVTKGVGHALGETLLGILKLPITGPEGAWHLGKFGVKELNHFGAYLGDTTYCNNHLQEKKLLFAALNENLPVGEKLPTPTDQELGSRSCHEITLAFQMQVQHVRALKNKNIPQWPVDREIAAGMGKLADKYLAKYKIVRKCYNLPKQAELLSAAVTGLAVNVTPAGEAAEVADIAGLAHVAEEGNEARAGLDEYSVAARDLTPEETTTQARYAAISTEPPPEGVPYFALGLSYSKNSLNRNLERFRSFAEDHLNHPVFSFETHGKSVNDLKATKTYIEIADQSPNVLSQLHKYVARSPDNKVLLFSLDGVDMAHFERYLKTDVPGQFTNEELKYILQNDDLFIHTRFFKNGKELTYDDLKKRFGNAFPQLFDETPRPLVAHSVAQANYEAISSATPPDNVPYFALGPTSPIHTIDHRIDDFTSFAEQKLHHPVINFHGHGKMAEDARVTRSIWGNIRERVRGGIPPQLHKIVDLSPGHKVILFDLDGIDLNRPSEQLQYVLEDQKLFDHTRFFKNGKELTFDQLKALFKEGYPDLFGEQKPEPLATLHATAVPFGNSAKTIRVRGVNMGRSEFRVAETSEAREKQIFTVLKKMHRLKLRPATGMNVHKIDELNLQAIQIASEELKARGISFKVVDPKKGEGTKLSQNLIPTLKDLNKKMESRAPVSPYRAEYDQLTNQRERYLHSEKIQGVRVEELKEKLQQTQNEIAQLGDKISEGTDRPYLIEHYKHMLQFHLQSVEQYKRFIAETEQLRRSSAAKVGDADKELQELSRKMASSLYPAITERPVVRELHNWSRPYIMITDSPSNPKLLNTIIKEHGDIVLSPNVKSADPKTLASVRRQSKRLVFTYPLELVFTDNDVFNTHTLHEIGHLTRERMHELGRETPYNVEVTARSGEKLHNKREGLYDNFMNFQELYTWNHDLKRATSPKYAERRLTSYNLKRGYIQRSDPKAYQVRVARGLKILSDSAQESLEAARAYLKTADPKTIATTIKGVGGAKQSAIKVPYVRDGRQIGTIEIGLVKLNETNKDQAVQMALDYLDRVESRIKIHQSNAQKVLDENSGVDWGQAWRPEKGAASDSNLNNSLALNSVEPPQAATDGARPPRRRGFLRRKVRKPRNIKAPAREIVRLPPLSELHLTPNTVRHLMARHTLAHPSAELDQAISSLREAQARHESQLINEAQKKVIAALTDFKNPQLLAKGRNSIAVGKNLNDVESLIGESTEVHGGGRVWKIQKSAVAEPVTVQSRRMFQRQQIYVTNGRDTYGIEFVVCAKAECFGHRHGQAISAWFTCGPNVLNLSEDKSGWSVQLNEKCP